jgi:hypothetical protein
VFRKLEKGRRDDIFMDLVVSFDGSLHAYTGKGGEGYLLANRKGVSFSPYNYRVLEDLELAVSSLLVAPPSPSLVEFRGFETTPETEKPLAVAVSEFISSHPNLPESNMTRFIMALGMLGIEYTRHRGFVVTPSSVITPLLLKIAKQMKVKPETLYDWTFWYLEGDENGK